MHLLKNTRFFLAFLLLCPALLSAQNEFCGTRNTSFQEGEKLSFKVYYNMGRIWITAGEAQFFVVDEKLNGHKTYHIIGDGKTVHSYEWFYKVRDKYETYIDKETMLPVKFLRYVNEGGVKFYNNITFNRIAGDATTPEGVFKVPKCTQDILSAIFYARNIDYNHHKPGDKIPFPLFLDNKVYNVYVRYIGKEKITTRYGTFNSIKIAPLLIEGTIFNGGEKMMIWVSDDDNHIPLRVNSPILIGSVKVDLMGFENLRNPFSGLLETKARDDE